MSVKPEWLTKIPGEWSWEGLSWVCGPAKIMVYGLRSFSVNYAGGSSQLVSDAQVLDTLRELRREYREKNPRKRSPERQRLARWGARMRKARKEERAKDALISIQQRERIVGLERAVRGQQLLIECHERDMADLALLMGDCQIDLAQQTTLFNHCKESLSATKHVGEKYEAENRSLKQHLSDLQKKEEQWIAATNYWVQDSIKHRKEAERARALVDLLVDSGQEKSMRIAALKEVIRDIVNERRKGT